MHEGITDSEDSDNDSDDDEKRDQLKVQKKTSSKGAKVCTSLGLFLLINKFWFGAKRFIEGTRW